MSDPTYEYDIAFSFAGEDRAYVDEIAKLLKEKGVSVFYDDFETNDLWGKDLGIHFDTIYRQKCRFVVIFISSHYKEKMWTNYELRNAISRAIEQKESEYILPTRFDDSEIPGIRPTIGYLDLRKKSKEELLVAIIDKIHNKKTILKKISPDTKILKVTISLGAYLYPEPTLWRGGQPEIMPKNKSQPTLSVEIVNMNSVDRYVVQPYFLITTSEGKFISKMHLQKSLMHISFPKKLSFGEPIQLIYVVDLSVENSLSKLEDGAKIKAIACTTLDEQAESSEMDVLSVLKWASSLRSNL